MPASAGPATAIAANVRATMMRLAYLTANHLLLRGREAKPCVASTILLCGPATLLATHLFIAQIPPADVLPGSSVCQVVALDAVFGV
jgi:hypothetical protein